MLVDPNQSQTSLVQIGTCIPRPLYFDYFVRFTQNILHRDGGKPFKHYPFCNGLFCPHVNLHEKNHTWSLQNHSFGSPCKMVFLDIYTILHSYIYSMFAGWLLHLHSSVAVSLSLAAAMPFPFCRFVLAYV